MVPPGESLRVVLALFGKRARVIEYSLTNRKGVREWRAVQHLQMLIPVKRSGTLPVPWYTDWANILVQGCIAVDSGSMNVVVPIFADQYLKGGQYPLFNTGVWAANVCCLRPKSASSLARVAGHAMLQSEALIVADDMCRTIFSSNQGDASWMDESGAELAGGYVIEQYESGWAIVRRSTVTKLELEIGTLLMQVELFGSKLGLCGNRSGRIRRRLNGEGARIVPASAEHDLCRRAEQAVLLGAVTEAIEQAYPNYHEGWHSALCALPLLEKYP